MNTPTGIFGASRKSALRYSSDFTKSGRKVHIDESLNRVRLYEKEDWEEKQKAEMVVDDLVTQLNSLPFGMAMNTPPPTDPRQIMGAREKVNSFLNSSHARLSAVATPPVNNFGSSRFGAIGEKRPQLNFESSSMDPYGGIHFGTSNNLNPSGFKMSNRFTPLASQTESNSSFFNVSNGLNLPSFYHAANDFNASTFNISNKFNASSQQASKDFKASTASTSRRRPTDSYKTALCNQYRDSGTCTYGSDCKYAHGVDELCTPPSAKPNYKTVLCRNFHEKGECPHGARCKFIHHRREENRFQKSSTSGFGGSRGRR